jgi:hypothetical protein
VIQLHTAQSTLRLIRRLVERGTKPSMFTTMKTWSAFHLQISSKYTLRRRRPLSVTKCSVQAFKGDLLLTPFHRNASHASRSDPHTHMPVHLSTDEQATARIYNDDQYIYDANQPHLELRPR